MRAGSPTCDPEPMRCLIVDDSPRFLDPARGLLERQGMTVVGVASTSADALRRTVELRPDVSPWWTSTWVARAAWSWPGVSTARPGRLPRRDPDLDPRRAGLRRAAAIVAVHGARVPWGRVHPRRVGAGRRRPPRAIHHLGGSPAAAGLPNGMTWLHERVSSALGGWRAGWPSSARPARSRGRSRRWPGSSRLRRDRCCPW
jgi:hypothetical protein